MQLLIAVLLLLSVQKEKTSLQELLPLLTFLQNGDAEALAKSKPFSDLKQGDTDAKAVLALFEALRGALPEEKKGEERKESPAEEPLQGIADTDILAALKSCLS